MAFSMFLVEQMQAQQCLYEALDSSGIPTRDAKRRDTGWSAGQTDIGWYEGFHLLCAINPHGVMTGFGQYTRSAVGGDLVGKNACNDPEINYLTPPACYYISMYHRIAACNYLCSYMVFQ